MTVYRTDAELIAGVRKWQRLLHLEDWEITATLVPQWTFSERSTAATNFMFNNQDASQIKLASYDTIDLVANPDYADMERTLVHELVHLHYRPSDLWETKETPAQSRAYERGIEATARALVELERLNQD